jgi:hypothetical protein
VAVGAADAATTRSPIDPEREVLGFIVNIRFKICSRALMHAAFSVFCVIFVERLGSRIAFDAAGRPIERIDAAAIRAKRRCAPGRPVSPAEDREWLHRRPIPRHCEKTQS